MIFVVIARVPAGGVADFQRYEAAVLPRLAEHGGRLERRLRSEDGTTEVHLVSFADAAAFAAFRADPVRVAAAPLLAASGAQTELVPAIDVHD